MSNSTTDPLDNSSTLECFKIRIKQELSDDDALELENITNSDVDGNASERKEEEEKHGLKSRSSDERPFNANVNEDFSGALDYLMNEQGYYEIAITGRAFEYIRRRSQDGENIYRHQASEVFKNILKNGKVFARMSPEQKANMIEEMQNETDEIIGM